MKISSAVPLLLLCGFLLAASCNKKPDPAPVIGTPESNTDLIRKMITDHGFYKDTTLFLYNADNSIHQLIIASGGADYRLSNYTYYNGLVVIESGSALAGLNKLDSIWIDNSGNPTLWVAYFPSQPQLTQYNQYAYSNGKLHTVIESHSAPGFSSDTFTYSWQNGNLASLHSSFIQETYQFQYNNAQPYQPGDALYSSYIQLTGKDLPSFNNANRLTSASSPGTSNHYLYSYDAQGHIIKALHIEDTDTTTYYYEY